MSAWKHEFSNCYDSLCQLQQFGENIPARFNGNYTFLMNRTYTIYSAWSIRNKSLKSCLAFEDIRYESVKFCNSMFIAETTGPSMMIFDSKSVAF